MPFVDSVLATLFRNFDRPVCLVAIVRRCASPLDETDVGKADAVDSMLDRSASGSGSANCVGVHDEWH